MHAQQWLEAWRSGAVVHEWTEIELTHGEHVARVKVSADSARIRQPNSERIRHGAGGFAVQQIADALSGHMLTAKLVEVRELAATVILEPLLHASSMSPVDASREIDNAIEVAVPFVSPGASPSQAKPGPWLVGGTAKPFVVDERCTEEWGVNHGWLVHESQVGWKQDRGDGKPGHLWLRQGTPCWPAVWAKGYFVLQSRGRAHRIGETRDQDDYASHVLIIHEECWLDGTAGVLTEALYTRRELCGLVTHDERPFASARHPGVPMVVELATSSPPDTEPAPVVVPWVWLDPELTHGERIVEWYAHQRELGVHEQPDGSNDGPEIREWHRLTERDGQPTFGKWLAAQGGNWCASSRSAAVDETRLPTDPATQPHRRASGFELEQDAKAAGTWRPTELAITGAFEPEPGDLATLQRGAPGSGLRHVVTVERNLPDQKAVLTVGGNEGNRFGDPVLRRYASLLGFDELPDPEAPRFGGPVPEQPGGGEAPELEELVDDGDNSIELAWHGIAPNPWALEEWHSAELTHGEHAWRVARSGIYVRDEGGLPRRTRGEPVTVTKILRAYGDAIEEAADLTGVPTRTILAMLATESGTNPKAERFEKHLNDWSFGAAQTLTATAHAMARRLHITSPPKAYPSDVSTELAWRSFLFEPRNSILIGVSYIAYNDERWGLLDDPVLAYAAYNAGSPRPSATNPWGVAYYRKKTSQGTYDALDTFAAWYGDACAVLS